MDKSTFYQPPTCSTCKHYRDFVDKDGKSTGSNVCTIDGPPKVFAFPVPQVIKDPTTGIEHQITAWSQYCAWPIVLGTQGCSKHEPRSQDVN